MTSKTCDRCKKELDISRFVQEKLKSGKGTYPRNICKTCTTHMREIRSSGDPKLFLRHVFNSLKNKRKDTCEWDLKVEDLCELWDEQDGRCALSNNIMTWKKGGGYHDFNASVDRIKPNGPYIKVNLQLVCYRVNLMKHTLDDHELYWWCKNIVTNREDY
tara:strand:+ start:529 stop:1008 length:480 start_codon:yes stop_codon:yes gene_type:complete